MKKSIILLLAVCLLSGGLFAQQNPQTRTRKPVSKERATQIKNNLDKQKKEQQSIFQNDGKELNFKGFKLDENQFQTIWHTFYMDKYKKKPTNMLLNPNIKIKEKNEDVQSNQKKNPQTHFQAEMTTLPSNRRMVGEFEEMQAVLVSLTSVPATTSTEYFPEQYKSAVEQIISQYGFMDLVYYIDINIENDLPPYVAVFVPVYWGLSNNQSEAYAIPLEGWVAEIGLYNEVTEIEKIWSKLIYEIQQADAQSWIRLTGIQDSVWVKDYFAGLGYPFTDGKYKFFTAEYEDAFWCRDWGPFGIYYDNAQGEQKLGFLDAKYYTGRPFDDEFPKTLFSQQNYDYYNLDVKMEGGNIMNDGVQYGTYGDVIYANNSGEYGAVGQYYWSEADATWYTEPRTPVNRTSLNERMATSFNFDTIVVQSLEYDGGTGHIDLQMKQFDEESILIANMPDKYSNMVDYKHIQQNREIFNSKKTAFGTNYRLLNAPMPRLDNSDMPTNNAQYNADPRSYLNGVTVNKTYIYPSFSAAPGDVNWELEQTNKAILENLLPGYRIVPIDARYLTPLGGAIHCVTMQIPAEPDKVINIRHKPIRDYVDLAYSFDISAELISNTNADKLVLNWQLKGDIEWHNIEMTTTDNKIYNATITNDFLKKDTVRYYISAQNGETILKCAPITGPQGYYEFHFLNLAIDQIYGLDANSSMIASIYPNPAADHINVIFENKSAGNVQIELLNSLGQSLSISVNQYFESGVFTLDIKNLTLDAGVYFLKMTTQNGASIASFVVAD